MKYLHGPSILSLSLALLGSGAICVLTTPVALHAQSTTAGDIAGIVTDSTGAAVPNAKIFITNSDTGFKQTLASGPNGNYRAPLLKPGNYKVEVSAADSKELRRM